MCRDLGALIPGRGAVVGFEGAEIAQIVGHIGRRRLGVFAQALGHPLRPAVQRQVFTPDPHRKVREALDETSGRNRRAPRLGHQPDGLGPGRERAVLPGAVGVLALRRGQEILEQRQRLGGQPGYLAGNRGVIGRLAADRAGGKRNQGREGGKPPAPPTKGGAHDCLLV